MSRMMNGGYIHKRQLARKLSCRHNSVIYRNRRFLRAATLSRIAEAIVRNWVMTESTQPKADRRGRLLEVAMNEMVKFERKESEFRRKDREERAAELQLPLDKLDVH